MPESPQQLTRDPVFQVNSCLWLVYRTPSAPQSGQSAYYTAGFRLRALNRKLGVSPEFKERFRKLGWSLEPPEPDLLMTNPASSMQLVLECKASSFGVNSTTSSQARKLLTLCADPNVALGTRGGCVVLYVLSEEDAELQRTTLEALGVELAKRELVVADSGTLGLEIAQDGLWASLSLLAPRKHKDLASVEGRVLVAEGEGKAARPLYIIPYDTALKILMI